MKKSLKKTGFFAFLATIAFLFTCCAGGGDSSDSDASSDASGDSSGNTSSITITITPSDNENDVGVTSTITLLFSTEMDDTTITANAGTTECSGSIQLSDSSFDTCADISFETTRIYYGGPDPYRTQVTLTPESDLEPNSVYQIKLSKDIECIEGEAIDDTMSHFTTSLPGKQWYSSSYPEWTERIKFDVVSFKNKLYMLGGMRYSSPYIYYLKDIWSYTAENGWEEVTDDAEWSYRAGHTALVFNDKLWVIGGSNAVAKKNDTWYSSDGISWTEASSDTRFSARRGHTSVVFNDYMWVIGGADESAYTNDVWYSSDGLNWQEATSSAGWSARGYHFSVVFNNKIWVMGGQSSGTSYIDDVWSSANGVDWTQVDSSASWGELTGATAQVVGNYIYVMGGKKYSESSSSATVNSSVWVSNDGSTWDLLVTADWSERVFHKSEVYNNKLWIMGGQTSGYIEYVSNPWYSVITTK